MKIIFTYFRLVVLLFIISINSYGQTNIALKGIKKLNVEVNPVYMDGTQADFRSLYLSDLEIKSDIILTLRLGGIQVDETLKTPKLIIDIFIARNVRNNSSGADGWYYLTAHIYLMDKVKSKRISGSEFEAITWRGGFNVFGTPQDNSRFSSEYVSDLAKTFLSDYLEVNPK